MKGTIAVVSILLSVVFASIRPVMAADQDRFFKVEAVDTMKYSRDASRDPKVKDVIAPLTKGIANMHATHIAIATPYDEEFYPILKLWVQEARKDGLKVWFRGNFSSWEGWFDYPKFTDPNDHTKLTYQFITRHPDLFEDGDIFTPVPEPENGGFGDPRQSDDIRQKFLTFLPQSYANCVNAFKAINVNVSCGYFSTNGDVAKMLTKDVVKQIGNRVVIDHYVKNVSKLISDIESLHEQYDAPIVLGEIGAPIPDIHGDMTEAQQAQYMRDNLKELAKINTIVEGVNYWTSLGGSTAIFRDDLTPKPAVKDISDYFYPVQVVGKITDQIGNPLANVRVSVDELGTAYTQKDGTYKALTTSDYPTITIDRDDVIPQHIDLSKTNFSQHTITKNVKVSLKQENFFFKLQLLWNKILHSVIK